MTTGNTKTSFHVYLLLWIVYSLNGILYPPASILARLSLLIIFLMSTMDALVVIMKFDKCSYIKGLNFLLLVFTVYGLYFIFIDKEVIITKHNEVVPHYVWLKTIYIALLPFYSFLKYSIKGCITKKTLIKLLPILLILCIVKFVENQYNLQDDMAMDQEGVTNNMGYHFVALLPFVFLLDKNKIQQYALLLFIFAFTLLSVKRGAILISVLCILWFLFNNIRYSNKRHKLYVILGAIIIGAVLGLIVLSFIRNNAYFSYRLEDTMSGDSSERDWMYSFMIEWYLDNNTITGLLLGNGPYTSIKLMGLPAHNDWLEIALAQGLLGIIVYVIYWFSLLKTALKLKKKEFNNAFCISVTFFIIYFVKTFFSMSYSSIPFSAMLIFAYSISYSFQTVKMKANL